MCKNNCLIPPILIIILIFSGCSDLNNLNQLDSDQFETKTKRINTLNREIISKSEFNNAEFELFNVNGFTNNSVPIPGASSLDYKFVIKVKTSDIEKWTEGMVKVESMNENID